MRLVCAGLVSLELLARAAHAAPSRWDRARDPSASVIERALTSALRARVPSDVPEDALEFLPDLGRSLALRSAVVLEMAGGEALADPAVWFFLGDALVASDRGRDEDGRRILRRALDAAPDSPSAGHAWFQVAIASNRLHDFAAEREAYGEALRLEWDRGQRANTFMNRGEASMSLGELGPARTDYLTALASTEGSEVHALAAWGLAVALARGDDLPDALRYVWQASQMRFFSPLRSSSGLPVTALELPSVFFTPEYEIYYYRALAAMAAAEHAERGEERKAALALAINEWQEYLAQARQHEDRWVSNAQAQLRWCERRRASR